MEDDSADIWAWTKTSSIAQATKDHAVESSEARGSNKNKSAESISRLDEADTREELAIPYSHYSEDTQQHGRLRTPEYLRSLANTSVFDDSVDSTVYDNGSFAAEELAPGTGSSPRDLPGEMLFKSSRSDTIGAENGYKSFHDPFLEKSRSRKIHQHPPKVESAAQDSVNKEDSNPLSSADFTNGEISILEELEALREEVKMLRLHRDAHPVHQTEDDRLYQVLHKVECPHEDSSATFLDSPLLIRNHHLGHPHIAGTRRIVDEEEWENDHDELLFVVYRTYTCPEEVYKAGVHVEQSQDHDLEPSHETIKILAPDLFEAVDTMFTQGAGLEAYSTNAEVMAAPYIFYYHFEKEIEAYVLGHETCRSKLEILAEYLDARTQPARKNADDHFAKGLVTPDLMGYLFKPKDILTSEGKGVVLCFIQESVLIWTPGLGGYSCTVKYHTFDGSFHSAKGSINIRFPPMRPRDATVRIVELSTYPLAYNDSGLRRQLLERGDIFFNCRTQRYVTCDLEHGNRGGSMGEVRYMIDVEAYHMLHDKDEHAALKDDSGKLSVAVAEDEDLLLTLPAHIEGFRMTDKRWVTLPVSGIKPVVWNKSAFENLVIDKTSKVLIEALVKNKIESDESIDFVEGKGSGLIVLLHGGPGTGKTLTAESVAEIAEKPLYRVTCGDVGTDAVKVEDYLESVFHLGRRWGCVVLLDEADVFLEERSLDNLQRNALVSVFLRIIEYFDGILILTSNRVGKFDEAFKSRIQLALRYKPLTASQREQVWTNFISRLEDMNEHMDVNDIRNHIPELAQTKMNGRQIRNAVNTGRQLARFNRKRLDFAQLQDVVRVSHNFDKYTEEVQEVDDETMAREKRDR